MTITNSNNSSASNEALISYLKKYLAITTPNFGIMLIGEWGCGKTYFIKNFFNNYNFEDNLAKWLYFSLNGVETKDELSKLIFLQLHPKLYGKYSSLFAHLALGFAGQFKVKELIKHFKYRDFINGVDNKVLVFDDLERCKIEMPVLLGFINEFVEHYSVHVILIADETNIKGFDDKDSDYRKRKEKLIGRTIAVELNLDSAFNQFIYIIKDSELKKCLNNNKQLILDIFNASDYKNLRLLKQPLINLDELVALFPKDFKRDTILIPFIAQFILFSIEYLHGSYPGLFSNLAHQYVLHRSLHIKDNKGDSIYAVFFNKYDTWLSIYADRSMMFLIGEHLHGKALSSETIEFHLTNSIQWHFEAKDPLWKLVDNPAGRDETEFRELYNEMLNNLQNNLYNHPFQLLQIADFKLYLSKNHIIPDSVADIINELKSKTDEMSFDYFDWDDEVRNVQKRFTQYEDTEFCHFEEYLKGKVIESVAVSCEARADELLALVPDEFDLFLTIIGGGHQEPSPVDIFGLLKYFDIESFWNALSSVSNEQLRNFGFALSVRYNIKHPPLVYKKKLRDEIDFLTSLRDKCSVKIEELNNAVSNRILPLMSLKSDIERCLSVPVEKICAERSC